MSDLVNNIVAKIASDIGDRSGIGYEWDNIDLGTKKEIYKKWRGIISKEIDRTDGWISVEDRLPEFDQGVLAFCKIWGRYIGTYCRIAPDLDHGHWYNGKQYGAIPPIYWQALPEPPK